MKKTPKNSWLKDTNEAVRSHEPAPQVKFHYDLHRQTDGLLDESHDLFTAADRPWHGFASLRHKFSLGDDKNHVREHRDTLSDDADAPAPAAAELAPVDDVSSESVLETHFDSISPHKTPAEVALDGVRCMCPACLSPPAPAEDASITTLPDSVAPAAILPTVVETTDAAASTATTYSLQLGETAQGNISFTGDRDWYAVTLQAGQTYTFALTGTGTNNVIDPYLRLYNAAGTTELINDDDSLPGNNSIFTYTATTSGTFYLAAGAFDDSGTGQYGISATVGTKASFDTPMGGGVIDTDSAWTSTPGTGAVVTYAFRQTAATYTVNGSDISTFTQLTATQIAAVRQTLQAWSEVSGITFVEVNPGGYSNNATMLFGNYTDANDGAGAFAFFPGSTANTAQAGDPC